MQIIAEAESLSLCQCIADDFLMKRQCLACQTFEFALSRKESSNIGDF